MVILFTDTNAKEIGVYKTCLWHQVDGGGFAMFQIKIYYSTHAVIQKTKFHASFWILFVFSSLYIYRFKKLCNK